MKKTEEKINQGKAGKDWLMGCRRGSREALKPVGHLSCQKVITKGSMLVRYPKTTTSKFTLIFFSHLFRTKLDYAYCIIIFSFSPPLFLVLLLAMYLRHKEKQR